MSDTGPEDPLSPTFLILELGRQLREIHEELLQQQDSTRSDLAAVRVAIMAGIVRAQGTLNAMRDKIMVNFEHAESVRVAHDNTRTAMRAMGDQIAAMERLIRRLQTAVHELKGAADQP